MTDPIRIYVGSDQRQGVAERTLEYSIRKHASVPVEVTFMRSGEGAFADWEKGRKEGQPEWKRGKWPTNFSNFRLCIPELAGYEGHAIYLDSDMLVVGDVAELFTYRKCAYTTCNRKRSEVAVIDCAALKGHIPPIKELSRRKEGLMWWRNKLWEEGLMSEGVPAEWNVLDKVIPGMRLLHFTDMRTQPWKPWPERFNYPKRHPNEAAVSLWEKYADEAQKQASRDGEVSEQEPASRPAGEG